MNGQARGSASSAERASATYAAAGVDTEAGNRAVELMRSKVALAGRPEVQGGIGGFAGLFRLDTTRYREPLLAGSTDGVGTKLAIAQAMDRHDTVGIDLVAMIADDLVVCGAEPLFLTDYLACGKIVPDRVAEIVGGVAEGCRLAGCALVGGETAEHPGVLGPDEYDLAGAATGVVEADAVLGPERVRDGDTVLAMASNGLHSNGYSLARHVLLEGGSLSLTPSMEGLGGQSLGEALLAPTRVYALDCLALSARFVVRTFAHITGGGLAANLSRVLPGHLDATLDRSTWTPPPIFDIIAAHGPIEQVEMERTFNMGVGMLGIVSPEHAEPALDMLNSHKVPAWVVGEVTSGSGAAWLRNSYGQ